MKKSELKQIIREVLSEDTFEEKEFSEEANGQLFTYLYIRKSKGKLGPIATKELKQFKKEFGVDKLYVVNTIQSPKRYYFSAYAQNPSKIWSNYIKL